RAGGRPRSSPAVGASLSALVAQHPAGPPAVAHPRARLAPLAPAALLFAAAAAIAHRLAPLHEAAGGLDFQRRELAAAGLLLPGGAAAGIFFAGRQKAGALGAICAALTPAELLRGGRPPYRSSPPHP